VAAPYSVGSAVPASKPKAAKPLSQRLRRATLGWRQPLIERAPSWATALFGPLARWLDMLIVDHGVFRLFYLNRHRLGRHAWRSAQPTPPDIRALARQGLRTIVNLRGERACGSYWLERDVCRKHGIELINFNLRSRDAPSRAQLNAARDLFERIEYPMLLHCKSGADRAGLMSVLYRFVKDGAPLAEAQRELSWRFGHFRHSDTGILDRVFERYAEDNARNPMPFFDWVDTVYDPVALKRSFRAKGWANRVVNDLLQRE
jgi:protein tyrosine phosphatase (PTP) superfamily phosphohydrolase (DUF442 family)